MAARGGRAGTAERALSRRGRAWALAQLVRPLNGVLFLAGVVVGGVLSAGRDAFAAGNLSQLLLAAASAALIGAAANSLNDAFDLAADRINRPERPLPSGRATPRAAWLLWAFGSAGGLVVSLWLSAVHAGLALAAVLLLYAYNALLKHTVLWGNLTVAFVAALALVYGGWAVGPPAPALAGAAFAFLTTLAREVIKDVEDAAGDAAVAAGTLPLVRGTAAAARVAAGVLVLTVALTPLPFLLLDYGGLYLLLVLAADALLLRALWLVQTPQPGMRAGGASRVLAGAMATGLAALAFSGVLG